MKGVKMGKLALGIKILHELRLRSPGLVTFEEIAELMGYPWLDTYVKSTINVHMSRIKRSLSPGEYIRTQRATVNRKGGYYLFNPDYKCQLCGKEIREHE